MEKIRVVLSQKWKGRMELNAIELAKTFNILVRPDEIELSYSKSILGFGYKITDYSGAEVSLAIPKYTSAVINPAESNIAIDTSWQTFLEPAFGLLSAWIPETSEASIQEQGGVLVSPLHLVKTHICSIIQNSNSQATLRDEIFWPLMNQDPGYQTTNSRIEKYVTLSLVPSVKRIERLGYNLEESCDLFLYFLVEHFLAELPFSTRKKAALKLIESLFGPKTLFEFAIKEAELPDSLQGSLFRTKAEQRNLQNSSGSN